MADLLLEIGTEELPSGYIEPALAVLENNLTKALSDARVDFGEVKTMGTPRRLAILVLDVSERQKPFITEIIGPPRSVGFDDESRPTLAAKKFAERVGMAVNKIRIKDTPKGPYLYLEKKEMGLPTKSLLTTMLPEVILNISFPRTMRWADLTIHFARPIHSILALFDSHVVSFRLGNTKSGRYVFGHRFMSSGKIKITESAEYIERLRGAHVFVDIEERKRAIRAKIERAAGKIGGCILADEELLDTVKNLVEYPAAVSGRYQKEFLRLPREILITAMREHQKYFAVVGKNGELMPWFVAVNNTSTKNPALVAKGHERVLQARLEDAQFFYKTDLKTSPDQRLERLKGVLFQAKLGTMYEKTIRVEKLSVFLAALLGVDEDIRAQVARAARLCKTDLVSHVVGEFPKLQGIMGRIYASASGEPEAVSNAIEEHYRPVYSGGPLPESLTGAILGIADKMDSICGCFGAGLLPTGTSDPYALRRQGIGIIQVILDKGFTFSLKALIEEGIRLFEETISQKEKRVADQVYEFLRNRMVQLLAEEGYAKDIIAAVVNVSIDHVPNVWNRIRALASLKNVPDFEPLVIAFKRVVNILKQAKQMDEGNIPLTVKRELFQEKCESLLFDAYLRVEKRVKIHLENGRFEQVLHDIASLRPAVDAFFDGVMVLTDNAKLRYNRLALLNQIAGLFESFADFSKIST